ncbi:MAG TPA: haloacid dehalogenase type II [Nitriliruptoraceae bacterium]|nr:haloacid dehalogenase type II [Nitriliruptoraceae bacterium]
MATVLFDVNETLLSLAPVTTEVDDLLGAGTTPLWFARLLHASLVMNHVGLRASFEEVGAAELQRVAASRGLEVDHDRAVAISAGLRRLPAHDDVMPGLASLRAAGHRLVAFTNGASDAVADQLAHAGIDREFDQVVSVDGGPTFKPDAGAYRAAAAQVGEHGSALTMVAAHDWDIAGARSAGWHTVFVQRDGPTWWLPLPPGPTVSTIGDVGQYL